MSRGEKLLAQYDAEDFEQPKEIKKEKRTKIIGFPILFYLPETRIAGGGAGSLTFRFRGDSLNTFPSNIAFGAAYTQNRQLLTYINFRVFSNNEKYLNYGEMGFFIYNYFFFGVGNQVPPDYEEYYGITYPRIRWHSLVRVNSKSYLGIRIDYDRFRLHDLEETGLLNSDIFPGAPIGVLNRGIGVVYNYDSRNIQFFPSSGWFIETLAMYTFTDYPENQKNTGKGFFKFIFDINTYTRPLKNHVLAFNFHNELNIGVVPFHSMAVIGGPRRMRGFYEGRYRDHHVVVLQSEYRIPVYGIFGMAAFISAGNVFSSLNDYEWRNVRISGGMGIRIKMDKKDHLNLRLDYGVGKNTNAFYLTFREAF